ncbi:MAG: hypothetical protein HKL90_04085 [Elusimicrobia bacterium]|nr:hypothetical protein [Elusimicrobiota bacterium]
MTIPLVVVLGAVAASAAGGPATGADAPLSSFLAQDAGGPTIDAKVSAAPGGALATALAQAREVELGCARPCEDPGAVSAYRRAVERASAALGATDVQVQAAVAHYLPGGKPRLRDDGAAKAVRPGDGRATDTRARAAAAEAASTGARMGAQAQTLAAALGTSAGAGAAAATAPGGFGGRTLTSKQLAALNRMPAAQSGQVRDLATAPPPAPHPANAEAHVDGLIANSKAYWDRVGSDPATSAPERAAAATFVSLFKMFNLDGFENSAFRLAASAADPAATRASTFKDAASVAGNAALSVAGVLPESALSGLAKTTRLSALSDWAADAARLLKPSPAITERVAQLQTKALTQPLTREEAAWLGERTNSVVLHTTDSKNFASIAGRTDTGVASGGRVAATTERFVYGTRREINSVWRQVLSGVVPKDGTVVFQGRAADLFSKHEVTGTYSLIKRMAGQLTTNGEGDIVITKAFYNAQTKTLSILDARMVAQGEKRFLLRSEGWSTAKLWGRRVVLDPAMTAATGFIVVQSAAASQGDNVFEYILPNPPVPR